MRVPLSRVPPTSAAAPSRVIVRASTDFLLRGLAEGIRTHGNLRRAIFLNAIVAANVAHLNRSATQAWRYAGEGDVPPDSERRPINTHSLAVSLGVSSETARRHVKGLVADGLCSMSVGGVIVPTTVLESDAVVRSNEVHWHSFWRMIDDLRAIGFDFKAMTGQPDLRPDLVIEPGWALAGDEGPPKRLVSRIVLNFYLQAIVGASLPFNGDWLSCAIFAAIMSANSERIARDPGEAWRYAHADTPPPDEARRGATVREAARRLGVPHETARRQIQSLIAQGRIERTKEGLFASMTYMQSAASRRSATEMTKAFYRMISSLDALSVDLDQDAMRASA